MEEGSVKKIVDGAKGSGKTKRGETSASTSVGTAQTEVAPVQSMVLRWADPVLAADLTWIAEYKRCRQERYRQQTATRTAAANKGANR